MTTGIKKKAQTEIERMCKMYILMQEEYLNVNVSVTFPGMCPAANITYVKEYCQLNDGTGGNK